MNLTLAYLDMTARHSRWSLHRFLINQFNKGDKP